MLPMQDVSSRSRASGGVCNGLMQVEVQSKSRNYFAAFEGERLDTGREAQLLGGLLDSLNRKMDEFGHVLLMLVNSSWEDSQKEESL